MYGESLEPEGSSSWIIYSAETTQASQSLAVTYSNRDFIFNSHVSRVPPNDIIHH